MQVPPGPADKVCPLHKKAMSRVCDKCPLWVKLSGMDPTSGEPIGDEWMCSLTASVFLMVDIIRLSGKTLEKTDKTVTAIDKFHTNMATMQVANLKTMMEPTSNAEARRIEKLKKS